MVYQGQRAVVSIHLEELSYCHGGRILAEPGKLD